MILYEQALHDLLEEASRPRQRSVRMPVSASLKMILSHDVVGEEDVPAFNNSAMDGFAVCSKHTENAAADWPIDLPVYASLGAGDEPLSPHPGSSPCAVEIMTGAVMPEAPFDAVVRIEDVEIKRSSEGRMISLRRPVRSGENVRERGSDFRAGQRVARTGERITAAHIMAFASLGVSTVPVQARPRVAILSTGKELIAIGDRREHASQIWNSTGPYLVCALEEFGCEVNDLGVIPDCTETFQANMRKALDWGADLVLSTGAVSMGKYDFVVDAFKSCGGTLGFHKVAIRPGKPICFGQFSAEAGRPVFFGLPGNPISTAVGLRFFVEPYLRALLGRPQEKGFWASLSNSIQKPEKLRCFYKAKVTVGARGAEVRLFPVQRSYVISSFVEANAWAVLPEAGSGHEEVKVFLLNGWEEVHDG